MFLATRVCNHVNIRTSIILLSYSFAYSPLDYLDTFVSSKKRKESRRGKKYYLFWIKCETKHIEICSRWILNIGIIYYLIFIMRKKGKVEGKIYFVPEIITCREMTKRISESSREIIKFRQIYLDILIEFLNNFQSIIFVLYFVLACCVAGRDKTGGKAKRLKISVKPTLTIYNENEIQWNGRVEKGIVKKCLSGARRMTRGQTGGVNASQRMNYARWRSRDSLFLQDGCQWWYSALVTVPPPVVSRHISSFIFYGSFRSWNDLITRVLRWREGGGRGSSGVDRFIALHARTDIWIARGETPRFFFSSLALRSYSITSSSLFEL